MAEGQASTGLEESKQYKEADVSAAQSYIKELGMIGISSDDISTNSEYEDLKKYREDWGETFTNIADPNPPSFISALIIKNSTQRNWRWCNKCQGLFFATNNKGVCPAGGEPSGMEASGDYSLINNKSDAPGQHNWRWCNKCQGLFFATNNKGVCPTREEAITWRLVEITALSTTGNFQIFFYRATQLAMV